MNEPKQDINRLGVDCIALFAVGDVVFHKTAGTKGIIMSQDIKCLNPAHGGNPFVCRSIASRPDSSPCHLVPNGDYTVSVDFGREIQHVKGFLLSANAKISREANNK